MFEIPENLPLSLAPLAWVLGRWQGWGMYGTSEGEEDQVILQDIAADIVGEQMRLVITLYYGTVQGELDPTLNAAGGLNVIEPGDFLREETSYWRLATPLAVVPTETDEPRELQVTSSDTQGLGVLWVGAAMGPRITLVSDVLARDASAPQAGNLHRMFGLVGGELFWTSEVTVDGEDPVVEISGRLQRVASANQVVDESE